MKPSKAGSSTKLPLPKDTHKNKQNSIMYIDTGDYDLCKSWWDTLYTSICRLQTSPRERVNIFQMDYFSLTKSREHAFHG